MPSTELLLLDLFGLEVSSGGDNDRSDSSDAFLLIQLSSVRVTFLYFALPPEKPRGDEVDCSEAFAFILEVVVAPPPPPPLLGVELV